MSFENKICEPCHSGAPAMGKAEQEEHLAQLSGWTISQPDNIDTLVKTYKFEDYPSGLRFALKVGEAAENHGHHPVLEISWGKVRVFWWTHASSGLHLNDFIMAEETDRIYAQFSPV
ncbi:MAG: 4a-hydroxytetrahydrobiopterin dehydratase [Porticoccaceae bacterium]|nr:4a-hydroxytetrahydrobiopterin dehydratase [Porticoccaceae bacterium]